MLDRIVLWLVQCWLRLRYWKLVKHCQKHNQFTPNISVPRSYVELMMWRKAIDRNPSYVMFSDKLATKDFLKDVCPGLKLSETLWTGEDPKEIPSECFSEGETWFKANHGSSYNLRCEKGFSDIGKIQRLGKTWLSRKYGERKGEWTYGRVAPKLFLEKSITIPGTFLCEFQIRAANGIPLLGSCTGFAKTPNQWHYYLDAEGRSLSEVCYLGDSEVKVVGLDEVMKPYLEAIEWTRKISRGCDYVRCDFFWNGKELYGGEVTVFPNAGTMKLSQSEIRELITNGWDIRKSHFLSTPQSGWRKWYSKALMRQLEPRGR